MRNTNKFLQINNNSKKLILAFEDMEYDYLSNNIEYKEFKGMVFLKLSIINKFLDFVYIKKYVGRVFK